MLSVPFVLFLYNENINSNGLKIVLLTTHSFTIKQKKTMRNTRKRCCFSTTKCTLDTFFWLWCLNPTSACGFCIFFQINSFILTFSTTTCCTHHCSPHWHQRNHGIKPNIEGACYRWSFSLMGKFKLCVMLMSLCCSYDFNDGSSRVSLLGCLPFGITMVVCGGNVCINLLVGINLLVFFVAKWMVTMACSKNAQEEK